MPRPTKKCEKRRLRGRSRRNLFTMQKSIPIRALRTVCLFFAACGIVTATATPAAKRPPNVILITIDTVRADHVGCYGYKDIQTPTLDALGHDGIVFEHAISQVPLT